MTDIQILPLERADLKTVPELQPEDWSSIVIPYKFYLDAGYCSPLKAVHANRIIGLGTTILHRDTAWLGHIIVHPDYRRQGIGAVITQRLTDIALQWNCETITLIATSLGAPVYEKLGFVTETEYLVYKDVLPADNSASPSYIIPYSHNLQSAVFSLDMETSGEDRSSYLSQHLNNAVVFLRNEIVEGFLLPGAGDGLVVASGEEAGLALLKARLQHVNHAVFPVGNHTAKTFYETFGYQPAKVMKRMVLGKRLAWQPEQLYNRVGGNLG